MVSFECPECGKHYRLKDNFTGKHAKCVCGAVITVPTRAADATPAQPSKLCCPFCQQDVRSSWKACPSCGQMLGAIPPPLPSARQTAAAAPPASPGIQTGDNSVFKADIIEPSSSTIEGDSPLPPPRFRRPSPSSARATTA